MSKTFPTKDNPQDCKNGCNMKIYLKKSDRTNPKTGNSLYIPYNLDDTMHDCRTRQETTPQNKEARIASIIKTIELIIKELEDLKQ